MPEVGDDGSECAEVQCHVERLVEGLVLPQVCPVADPRDENQMSRRGDRQQLGEPLNEAQDERLPVGQLRRVICPADQRQDERGREERRCGSVDEGSAHRRIVEA